ncbi:MAG: hypothetical protein HQL50_11095, partial [Magnetococcales bacterium]|nr:hypothetical protein [Magnetococcales bacterium]
MALITMVEPEDATGEVADIFNEMEKFLGHIPEAQKLYAVSPGFLQATVANIRRLMTHPRFSKSSMLAWVRFLIARETQCAYCIDFNQWLLLNRHNFTLDQLETAKREPSQTPLPEDELALLTVILKVVADSNSLTAEDISHLKELGWNEADIFEAISHATSMVGIDMLL